LAGVATMLLGAVMLITQSLQQQREVFETEARIAHRLMSQRAVQHEAVLVTLSLMQPLLDARLPAVYPQFLQVLRRTSGESWPLEVPLAKALASAELANSAGRNGPRLGWVEMKAGRFWIVAPPPAGDRDHAAAYALEVSLPLMVPWSEWPFGGTVDADQARQTRVWLAQGDSRWTIHAGSADGELWRFRFSKHLAAESQPFDLVAERSVRLSDLPWLKLAVWLVLWLVVFWGVAAALRHRRARRRAEELLRMGQVSRLNALGELAAGLAHELNQPLTAVLANTQAASRMLGEDENTLEIETIRSAMSQAVTQARRAAEVVARLRRAIERPNAGGERVSVDLAAAAREALHLLEPESRQRKVTIRVVESPATMAIAAADPVAVAQIIHNLLSNALNALEQGPTKGREIVITPCVGPKTVSLSVCDNGPGVSASVADRLFEPFVSGHEGGLGLGLSLCETLASEMEGRLYYRPAVRGGAEFILELPASGGSVAPPDKERT